MSLWAVGEQPTSLTWLCEPQQWLEYTQRCPQPGLHHAGFTQHGCFTREPSPRRFSQPHAETARGKPRERAPRPFHDITALVPSRGAEGTGHLPQAQRWHAASAAPQAPERPLSHHEGVSAPLIKNNKAAEELM